MACLDQTAWSSAGRNAYPWKQRPVILCFKFAAVDRKAGLRGARACEQGAVSLRACRLPFAAMTASLFWLYGRLLQHVSLDTKLY